MNEGREMLNVYCGCEKQFDFFAMISIMCCDEIQRNSNWTLLWAFNSFVQSKGFSLEQEQQINNDIVFCANLYKRIHNILLPPYSLSNIIPKLNRQRMDSM